MTFVRSMRVLSLIGLLVASAQATILYNVQQLGPGTIGWGMNSAGRVTGRSNGHAVIWTAGSVLDLGTLGGTGSDGISINSNGWVAGNSLISANAAQHSFLWNGSSMQDLSVAGT